MEIWADSVEIISELEAVATFNRGVPVTPLENYDVRPQLMFTLQDSTTAYLSRNDAGNASGKLKRPFSLSSSSSGVECSFAGGCEYSVSGTAGIQQMFHSDPENNYVKVCEKRCEYDDESSTADEIKCKLPAIPTTYSNLNYGIGAVEQALNSGVYFGVSQAYKAFNDDIFDIVNDNSNTCILGMEFREGYVGSLQQVKYFIDYITDRGQYENNLAFEGSADGEEYTELFVVDGNVHEGWNYVDFEEGSYPNYRFYRFRGLGGSNGPCKIHEIAFKGNEVIQSEDETYDCTPQLVLKDVEEN